MNKESQKRLLLSDLEEAVAKGNLARRRHILEKLSQLEREPEGYQNHTKESRTRKNLPIMTSEEEEYMREAWSRAESNNFEPTNLITSKKPFWKVW